LIQLFREGKLGPMTLDILPGTETKFQKEEEFGEIQKSIHD
jgi:hypothetical protein